MPPTPTTMVWELQGNARFQPRRCLGRGGFGAVYEVFDRERGARVALKVLQRLEAEDLYRFKQEFRALADIVHPNLVHLYELLGEGERWFFTMELVEGTDALDFVWPGSAEEGGSGATAASSPPPAAGGPPYDEARLRAMLLQIVEGLAALHDAGKIHRDIKPSNILVSREGRVVIVDFGLSVRLSVSGELSRSALVGTPDYLAPELARGKPAGPASDWYGVGVLLFQALTGRLPFTGPLPALLAQKITRRAPAPSALVPGVPPDLDRLCAALLAREPQDRPDAAELIERLGGSAAPRAGRRAIPFVGRTAERAALAELFDGVRRGEGAAVALVGGVSGIGKSALVSRAVADVRRRAPGAVLLVGRCWEQESMPYKAIDGLVDPLSRHLTSLPKRLVEELLPHDVHALARIFPVLEQVEAIARAPLGAVLALDAQARRRAAFRALRELLGRLARERPLVLVIDDLQWGDRDSGALLIDLLRPPDPPPLLLIAAYRSDEAETSACLAAALPALKALGGAGLRVASMELDALADAEATELARALLPEVSGEDRVAAVVREAGRRPYFLRELCEASREAGTPLEEMSLDALIRARAAALPEGAQRLLEILSVAGRPVDRGAAARAAGLGDDEPAVYAELRAAHLVRSRESADHDEIEPYHDRIREAVTAGLPGRRRVEVLLLLTEALAGSDRADAESLATWLVEGGRPEQAVTPARQAAEEAVRQLAFDRAVRLYRMARDLCPTADPRAQGLREELAEALVTAGHGAEAAEAFAVAAATAAPERAFELRRRATEHLLFAGRVDEGLAALRRCLADLGFSLPTGAWHHVLGALYGIVFLALRGFGFRARSVGEIDPGMLLRVDTFTTGARAFSTTDTLLAAHLCTLALRSALAAGEPRRVLEALGLFSALLLVVGGSASGLVRRIQEAIDPLAAQLDDPRARGVLALVAGNAAMQDGDPARAREPLHAVAEVVRGLRPGASFEVNLVHELTCFQLHWSGAWRALSAALAAIVEEARGQGNQHLERSLSNWFGHVPALLADDPEGAERVQAEARAGWWPPQFGALDHFSFLSHADIHLYADRGAGERAYRHVEGLWRSLERAQLHRLEAFAQHQLHVRSRAALAFAASAGAGPEERRAALRIVEQATRRLARMRSPLARAFREHLTAGLAAARGEPHAAISGYERAAEAFAALGCALHAAATKWRRGLLLGDDEGGALTAEAEVVFAAEGARDPARIAAMLAPGPRKAGAPPS